MRQARLSPQGGMLSPSAVSFRAGLDPEFVTTTQRVLGEEHSHTLTSMNNLAFTWKAQSQDTKVVNLIQECIRLQSRILGVDHPNTLSSSAVLTKWQKDSEKGLIGKLIESFYRNSLRRV